MNKKNYARLISLFLCVLMVFTSLGGAVQVFAADETATTAVSEETTTSADETQETTLPHETDNNAFPDVTEETIEETTTEETTNENEDKDTETDSETETETGCLYLSDIDYLTTSPMNSASSWNGIKLDTNYDGNQISVVVEGKAVTFPKGVAAHANSNLYYDLTEYNEKYEYFVCYAGVDASRGSNGNGIIPWVYSSEDGTNWTVLVNAERTVYKGDSEALYIKIPIAEIKYLRLQAYDNGANGADHAVWADAKLVTQEYLDHENDGNPFKTVEEYDQLLSNCYEDGELKEDYQLLLLQRELVSKAGYKTLGNMIKNSDNCKTALDWLMNSEENLEMYLLGGDPIGSYQNSFTVLGRLLKAHEEDLSDENETFASTYKTMMIALSLTHSSTVRFWISDVTPSDSDGSTSGTNSKNVSDAVRRYEVYKKMMKLDKLHQTFYTLTVEEMRLVMNSKISDYEIEWLRDYSYNRGTVGYLQYSDWWITYKNQTYMWHNDAYYDMDTIESYSEQYGNFLDYGVTVEKYNPSIWMVYASWGICWHISNTGANLVASQGVPVMTFGQPSHVSYAYALDNGEGSTNWVAHYFVSNWNQTNFTTYSGDRGYYVNRPYMNWGIGSYTTYNYNASYVWLSQQALDDYDNFAESQKLVMTADVYSSSPEKQKEIYLQAIEKCGLNFDAYLNLAYLYRDNPTVATDAERYELALKIVSNLGENPLPVNDLLTLITNQLTDTTAIMQLGILKNKTVKSWLASSNGSVVNVASAISGTETNSDVASFSFDGENANTIMLTSNYQNIGANWNYSFDGGETWSDPGDIDFVTLSESELAQINPDDDIKIHIMGTTYDEENLYTIDITKSSLPSNLYRNDYENRIMGSTNTMQWRRKNVDGEYIDSDWTYYKDENPRFEGDVIVEVRVAPNATAMASDTKEYRFYADTQTDTRKYVYIENLSLMDVSSAQSTGEGGAKVIDGFASTIWHTKWDGSDSDRWVAITLNQAKYISAVQYLPRQDASNGRAKEVNVYTSTDGETWTLAGSASGWANSAAEKSVDFDSPVLAKYIKFQITSNYGDGRSFGSAAMINIFEDTTIPAPLPEGTITYSTDKLTNKSVTATLTVGEGVTITNNEGSGTYEFNENGEFTFELLNDYGYTNSVTAKVTWIHDCDTEGHVKTTEKGYAATCTAKGLTDKVYCSACGEVFTKAQTIAAKGHSDKDDDGQCDSCGEILNTASTDCSCICHKTGFSNIIYKIIRVFWKLFKTNKTCSCGVVHY